MAARAPLALVGLVLTSASLILLFFVILSGVTRSPPLNRTYFLQADTSGINGARDITQWTFFYICGLNNQDCSRAKPAQPFGDAWDANSDNVPDDLAGKYGGHTTSYHFWYMWRFGWVFFLMTLFFVTLAFFSSLIACCGRLGSAVAGLMSATALVFSTIACVLMAVTFVEARDAFKSDGRNAKVGVYAFAFAWASWTALLIATVLFCVGTRGEKRHQGRAGFRFGRSGSRRSYTDGRRVKDEYH